LDNMFKMLGQGMNREKMQEILDEVDEGGIGELSWPKFLKVMRLIYPEKRLEFEREFYGAASHFPEFSTEEIQVFIDTFRTFDFEGVNSINVDGLGKLFDYMGQGCTREALEDIILAVDDNNNGVVDWVEFLEIMRTLYPEKKAEYERNQKSQAAKQQQGGKPPMKSQQSPSNAPRSSNIASPSAIKAAQQAQAQSQSQSSSQSSNQSQNQVQSQNQNQNPKPSVSSGGSGGDNSKCNSCGKTVYRAEALLAMNVTWHKGCFRCQQEGCGITLNLKTFRGAGGKIYCAKHIPTYKATSTTTLGI